MSFEIEMQLSVLPNGKTSFLHRSSFSSLSRNLISNAAHLRKWSETVPMAPRQRLPSILCDKAAHLPNGTAGF